MGEDQSRSTGTSSRVVQEASLKQKAIDEAYKSAKELSTKIEDEGEKKKSLCAVYASILMVFLVSSASVVAVVLDQKKQGEVISRRKVRKTIKNQINSNY